MNDAKRWAWFDLFVTLWRGLVGRPVPRLPRGPRVISREELAEARLTYGPIDDAEAEIERIRADYYADPGPDGPEIVADILARPYVGDQ